MNILRTIPLQRNKNDLLFFSFSFFCSTVKTFASPYKIYFRLKWTLQMAVQGISKTTMRNRMVKKSMRYHKREYFSPWFGLTPDNKSVHPHYKLRIHCCNCCGSAIIQYFTVRYGHCIYNEEMGIITVANVSHMWVCIGQSWYTFDLLGKKMNLQLILMLVDLMLGIDGGWQSTFMLNCGSLLSHC